MPIYNRFDGFIHFEKLNDKASEEIIEKYYKKYFNYLNSNQQRLIEDNNVKQLLMENSMRFNNAREIERIVRDVILSVLANNEIYSSK